MYIKEFSLTPAKLTFDTELPDMLLQTSGRIVGISILLIFVLVLAFSLFYRKKKYRSTLQRNELLYDMFIKTPHELSTPFTIILGLSKQLRDQKNISNGNLSIYLNAIERQGKNITQLFNQLSDIANSQGSENSIEWKTGNIVAFVEMASEVFRIYAEQKNIELFFFCEDKEIITDFVPDYVYKILSQLIDNAIKFSNEGSRINLLMEKDKKCKHLLIKVIDYGIGINEEIMPHIFDLFYRSNRNSDDLSLGKGVGLTVAKQLTDAMGGTINVVSEVQRSTMFTIELPIRNHIKHPQSLWQAKDNDHLRAFQSTIQSKHTLSVHELFSNDHNENDPRKNILLVENNKDIALYIRSIFPEIEYNIFHAADGEEAWDKMNKITIDIVITAVIMPKISGIELCKLIRKSTILNHMPIILISKKNGKSDIIEGLKSGADGYLQKPFYPEELQVRVENLLNSRQLLKEKYSRTLLKDELANSNENISNMDSNFLRHVTDIIYRELKNPELNSEKLARELAISVSQLNKKLNTLTGYPSSTYILQIRLQQAKKILNTQDKTIGEVATECGIYDVNYFSRIFKKNIGITPSQYKRLNP